MMLMYEHGIHKGDGGEIKIIDRLDINDRTVSLYLCTKCGDFVSPKNVVTEASGE